MDGPVSASLQVCRQHPDAKKMYIPQSKGKILVSLRDCPRQKLHSYFENAPYNEGNEKQSDDMDVESQAAGYFAIVRGRYEAPFRICEGSRRTVCGVR